MGHVAADSRQRVALQYEVTTVTKNTVHFAKNVTRLGYGQIFLHDVINISMENGNAEIE